MDRRFPTILLNRVDLPTFGLPTTAISGFDIEIPFFLPEWSRSFLFDHTNRIHLPKILPEKPARHFSKDFGSNLPKYNKKIYFSSDLPTNHAQRSKQR